MDFLSFEIASSLTRIRADAALGRHLRFWIGQNLFAVRSYPDLRKHADAAVAAIDVDLKASP